MKVLERTLDVDSTLEGERVGMTIDQGALAHIMSVLTDLYSDPELAVIREYATNALDAHIAAGVTRPIEVTLPTPLSPFLRIRDYGAGLDADDIRDIYSRYGTSTKRDSNDVVGMLGLGCKSALTYTDQFTLTGTKLGVTTQVSISRDEDGAGSMTIVSEDYTDADSGVEVVIPAKRHNALEQKAHAFFRFWDEGTVLVNGEPPKRIDGTWITPKLCLVPGDRYNRDTPHTVVMGNVPYPVENAAARELGWQWPYGYSLVAFVDIGDVQFTPSREALQMTRHTKATLSRINTDAQAALAASLTRRVREATTPAEAIELARQARALGVKNGLTYMGREVPDALSRPTQNGIRPQPYLNAPVVGGAVARKAGDWSSICRLTDDTLYFDGFEGAELTPTKRAKFELYQTLHELPSATQLVFCTAFTAEERFWIPKERLLRWEPVNELKLPKKVSADGTTSTRPRGSYNGKAPGQGWYATIEADKIDTSKPVLWLQGNIYEAQQRGEVRRGLVDVSDDITIVCLQANRVEKFKRDFPMAVHVNEYAREKARAWFKGLAASTLEAARFQLGGVSYTRLRALDADRVNDPELAKAIRLAQFDVKPEVLQRLSEWLPWIGETAVTPENPADKYPLISYARDLAALKEDTILYVNAAYAAEKEV